MTDEDVGKLDQCCPSYSIEYIDLSDKMLFYFISLLFFLEIMYLALHHAKGSIWTDSQGVERYQTQWEQMDNGEQYTANRKFYTVVPIVV